MERNVVSAKHLSVVAVVAGLAIVVVAALVGVGFVVVVVEAATKLSRSAIFDKVQNPLSLPGATSVKKCSEPLSTSQLQKWSETVSV